MATDITSAFNQFQSAFAEFHSAVVQFQDPDAPAVLRAIDQLADAYTIYDDVIFTEYGVEAPFDTFVDEYGENDDFADEDEDDIEDYDDEDFDDFDDDFIGDYDDDDDFDDDDDPQDDESDYEYL